MASNINTTNIDTAYPVAGQDNDSQGFRDNFTNINSNFIEAKTEIEALQDRDGIANYTFSSSQVPSLAEDNYVLTYNNSTGEISLESASAGGINISDDASPTLGGNLDVDTYSIISSGGLDIAITPHTTGSIVLDGLSWPQADGTADYVLKTDGLGQLGWVAQPTFTTELADDGSPQLAADLDVQANAITTSTTNGDITLTPDGTGNVVLGTVEIDADQTLGAGQDNYVLTYDNGTGTASFEAAAGGGGGGTTITLLDTKEIITSINATTNSWVTGTSATLSSNSATAAILSINVLAADAVSTVSILCDFFLRKKGTGAAFTQNFEKIMQVGTQSTDGSSSTNLLAYNSGEFTVPLDGSFEFEWQSEVAGVTNTFVDIILVGYHS